MNKPKISVVMSVYNTEENWLRASIESILNQTFGDFEFIIILDSPTDSSDKVVKEYGEKDGRIKIVENITNIGLTKSLNKGIKIAKGDYIARMDADDISVNTRFEKQFRYMENNPSKIVVGSYIAAFGNDKVSIGSNKWKNNFEKERVRLLFGNAGVPHPTAFIRKSFLDKHKIKYRENLRNSQDYGLWVDIVQNGGEIYQLSEVQLLYRLSVDQISSKNILKQNNFRNNVILNQISMLFVPTDQELEIHVDLTYSNFKFESSDYINYLKKLIESNKRKRIYDYKIFNNELYSIWVKFVIKSIIKGKKFKFILNLFTFKSLFNIKVISSVIYEYINYCKYKKKVKKFYKKNKDFYTLN